MRGNRKYWKKWMFLLTVMLSLCFSPLNVRGAADGVSMANLGEGVKGTLTLHLGYTDTEENVKNISGVGFSVYKVAELTVNRGNAVYTLLKNYQRLDIDFDGMTASESAKAAAALSELTKSVNPDYRGITEKDGCTTMWDLEPGMYLVVQSSSTGEAVQYSSIVPFLVSVPEGNTDGGTGTWNYDVKAEPKTEIKKTPVSETPPVVPSATPKITVTPGAAASVTPSSGSGGGTGGSDSAYNTSDSAAPVKTADNTPLVFWTSIFTISAVCTVYLCAHKKHGSRN